MDEHINVARRAADILSTKYDYYPELRIEVEKQVAAEAVPDTNTYAVAEIVAVAGFLLSLASFAYDVYKDRRDKGMAETIRREMRVKVKAPVGVSTQKRDQLIQVVVEQFIKSDK